MEQVTENVFTNTKLRGCNPSFVTTSDGVVVIDTPQLPTKAVEMRTEAEKHGPIRYLINTEHHVDHIFGNYFFMGAGTVVHHQGVYDNFMVPTPELNPYDYAKEALPTDDPDGEGIFPDEETYFADPNKASIVFTGDLRLDVGDHTFDLLHTPGHTPGQVAVFVPDERVVFTGDTIFSDCQTWLMTSDVGQWLDALERIRQLEFDFLVPGHGPVTDKAYLDTQRMNLMEWETAVAAAIASGWSREETVERVNFRDKCSVDIGQEYMMDHIQENNAGALYDRLST
ncbi:MAG: MBL fold metallo-hydrolase [Actinobacteria bacterium]|nr:MBL fold metallo-hydrolase [Actinomycetota bacterium]